MHITIFFWIQRKSLAMRLDRSDRKVKSQQWMAVILAFLQPQHHVELWHRRGQ